MVDTIEAKLAVNEKQKMLAAEQQLQETLQGRAKLKQIMLEELASLQALLDDLEALATEAEKASIEDQQNAADLAERERHIMSQVETKKQIMAALQTQDELLLGEIQSLHAKTKAVSPYELNKNAQFVLPKPVTQLLVGIVIAGVLLAMLPATWPIWAAAGAAVLTAAAVIGLVNYTPVGKLWLGAKELSLMAKNLVVGAVKGLFNIATASELDYADLITDHVKNDKRIPVWAADDANATLLEQAFNKTEDHLLANLGANIFNFRAITDEQAKERTAQEIHDGVPAQYDQWLETQARWSGLETDLIVEVIADFTRAANDPLPRVDLGKPTVQEAFKVLQARHEELQAELIAAKGDAAAVAAVKQKFVSAQYQFYQSLQAKGLVTEARLAHPKVMEHIDNMLGIKPWVREAYTAYQTESTAWVAWLEDMHTRVVKDKDMNDEQRKRAVTALEIMKRYAAKIVRTTDNPSGLAQLATGINESDAMHLAKVLGAFDRINSAEFAAMLASEKAAVTRPLADYEKLADACQRVAGHRDVYNFARSVLDGYLQQHWLSSGTNSLSAKRVLKLLADINDSAATANWTAEAKTQRMIQILEGYAGYLRQHEGDKQLYAKVEAMAAALHAKVGRDTEALSMNKVFAAIRKHVAGEASSVRTPYNSVLADELSDRLVRGKTIDHLLNPSEAEQLQLMDTDLAGLSLSLTQLTEELALTMDTRVTDEARLADSLVSSEQALEKLDARVAVRGEKIDAYNPTWWNNFKADRLTWFFGALAKAKVEHNTASNQLSAAQLRLVSLEAEHNEVTQVAELGQYIERMAAKTANTKTPSEVVDLLVAQITFLNQTITSQFSDQKVVDILQAKQKMLQQQLATIKAVYTADDQMLAVAYQAQLSGLRQAANEATGETQELLQKKCVEVQKELDKLHTPKMSAVLEVLGQPDHTIAQLDAWVAARKQVLVSSDASQGPDGESVLGTLEAMRHDAMWLMYHIEREKQAALARGDKTQVASLQEYHNAAAKFIVAFDKGFIEKSARDQLLVAARELMTIIKEPPRLLTSNAVVNIKQVLLDAAAIRNAEQNIERLGDKINKLQSLALQAKGNAVVSDLAGLTNAAFAALDEANARYQAAQTLLASTQHQASEVRQVMQNLQHACQVAAERVLELQHGVQAKIEFNAQQAALARNNTLIAKIVKAVQKALGIMPAAQVVVLPVVSTVAPTAIAQTVMVEPQLGSEAEVTRSSPWVKDLRAAAPTTTVDGVVSQVKANRTPAAGMLFKAASPATTAAPGQPRVRATTCALEAALAKENLATRQRLRVQ